MPLYHASRIENLKILKPHPHNAVDGEKVVFATSDKLFALAMTYGSGVVLAACYAINHRTRRKEFYLDEIKPNSLRLLENPASLYIVEGKKFSKDKRLKNEEFVSKTEVRIIKEIKIKNVLNQLKKFGANLISYDDVPESMKNRGEDPDYILTKYKKDRFEKIKEPNSKTKKQRHSL
jgi:hypothetical protein